MLHFELRNCGMLRKVGVLFLVVCFLAGCSKSFDDDADIKQFKGKSEKAIYDEAKEKLNKEDYHLAITRYEALETLYPFSRYSKPAQRDIIYAYYQNEDYAQCAASSERYIHLYPRDPDVDYAYYMRAMANFAQQRGAFAKFLTMDVSWRAPGTQLQSYQDFLALVRRFPHSKYYADSMQHLIYLRNQFAQRELNIAGFYYQRQLYVAALNRSNYVIKHFGQSPQAKKALKLSKKINKILAMHQGSEDDNQVLRDTYKTKPRRARRRA